MPKSNNIHLKIQSWITPHALISRSMSAVQGSILLSVDPCQVPARIVVEQGNSLLHKASPESMKIAEAHKALLLRILPLHPPAFNTG